VANGETGDVACDHYHRYAEDIELMASFGIRLYRFSISWPRLVAADGRANPAGVDFYRRLCEGLRERGITPLATLYHWDLPQAVQDDGGWANRDTTARFAEYAAIACDTLGDLVDSWITQNEPWVTAYEGHGFGTKAPGEADWPTAVRVSHHLLLSHGLAMRALRERSGSAARVGIALNLHPASPLSDTDEDRAAARIADGFHNRWFLDPVLRGGYPADMLDELTARFGPFDAVRDGDLEAIAEPIDFLGVNYYFGTSVYADADAFLGFGTAPPKGDATAMGWGVTPDALHALLVRLRREYGEIPLVITENGAAFDDEVPVNGYVDDPKRLRYLREHLGSVARAIEDGVDVRGYCAWSLLDNFEWQHGYSKRFGIVYVDYETLRRIPKTSALWYRDLITSNTNGGAG
jgi:beta-glucosidase